MIAVMIRLSSLPEDILVGIGPHVGGCCYNVDAGRIKRFYKAFGPVAGMIKNKNFLDLSAPAKMQLVHSGILAKNIENSSVCTSCQNKDFFSQRKDKPETYGGQLGVIKQ
jgi:copper oxidase (laccase) domain-containing protein